MLNHFVLVLFVRERQAIISQIVQDSMDWWIPATNLGFTNLNDGVLGALGLVQSCYTWDFEWIR
jgi:peroxin-11B